MKVIRKILAHFPAFSWAAILALGISVLVYAGVRTNFMCKAPNIFLLGDSSIGNYRLEPGSRLEDYMERMNPGVRVQNWAEPGATPMDFFLQYTRGTLLAGQPQVVVIGMAPDKFYDRNAQHRFSSDASHLRWIPWNSSGWDLFKSLSLHQKNVAVIQQASLPFFAVADFSVALWNRFVKWPSQRNAMLTDVKERRRIAEEKSFLEAKEEESLEIADDAGYAELPQAKDTEFLLKALRQQGIETRIMVLPLGDPGLIQATCSPRVLAKQDTLVIRMRRWLDHQNEIYVDFNSPGELEHFPDSAWDDWNHLKSPSAFAYISEKVKQALPTLSSRTMSQPMTLLQPSLPEADHRLAF